MFMYSGWQNVFDELLKNDEDMLKMYLTEKKKRGGLLPDSHEECELLIEGFHRFVVWVVVCLGVIVVRASCVVLRCNTTQ
jgi:hypothetical protein